MKGGVRGVDVVTCKLRWMHLVRFKCVYCQRGTLELWGKKWRPSRGCPCANLGLWSLDFYAQGAPVSKKDSPGGTEPPSEK